MASCEPPVQPTPKQLAARSLEPIFNPRRYSYSPTELREIRKLSPMTVLAKPLRYMGKKPRPPYMHCGWLVDEAEMLARAEARGCTQWLETVYVPADDEDLDIESIPPTREIEELATLDLLVSQVVKNDLHIRLPTRQYVRPVWAEGVWSWAITMYDNYQLDRVPDEADVNKIREAFNLSERPMWFMDGTLGRFQWRF